MRHSYLVLGFAYRVMGIKIKIRISRKVVIILSSAVVLFGASGAAALYLGRDAILGPSHDSVYGLECQDVVRIADVRGRDIPWLRKYIRVANTDGETRLKTALRVAKHMEETLPAELIHVAVLDENGPTVRAQMRGRAFGAQVFIFPDPEKIPGESQEYQGYYYEGKASEDGIFYGDKHKVSAHQLEELAEAMVEPEDVLDCTPPEDKLAAAGETSGHGSGGGESSSGHGEATSEHGDAGEGGGEHGASEGEHGAADAEGHEAAAEPGFFGKMLSFVGLGSSEESAAHGEAADHGEAEGHESKAGGEHGASAGGHGEAAAGHEEASAAHGESDGHAGAAQAEPGFFGKMKSMIGLGGSEEGDAAASHGAEHSSEDHGDEHVSPDVEHGSEGGHAGGNEASHEEPLHQDDAHAAAAEHGSGHQAETAEEIAHGASDHGDEHAAPEAGEGDVKHVSEDAHASGGDTEQGAAHAENAHTAADEHVSEQHAVEAEKAGHDTGHDEEAANDTEHQSIAHDMADGEGAEKPEHGAEHASAGDAGAGDAEKASREEASVKHEPTESHDDHASSETEAAQPASDVVASGPDAGDEGWDGGEDGEIVIKDGPSDALMLGWEDETLDAPEQKPKASEAAHTPAPKLDHTPVSSVEGNEDAAFH